MNKVLECRPHTTRGLATSVIHFCNQGVAKIVYPVFVLPEPLRTVSSVGVLTARATSDKFHNHEGHRAVYSRRRGRHPPEEPKSYLPATRQGTSPIAARGAVTWLEEGALPCTGCGSVYFTTHYGSKQRKLRYAER